MLRLGIAAFQRQGGWRFDLDILLSRAILLRGMAVRCVTFCLWLMLAWAAIPASARADVLVATNGERFVGQVVAETADTVVFESELGGRLTLPRSRVREIQRAMPVGTTNAPPTTRPQSPGTNQFSALNSQPSTYLSWLPPSLGHDNLDWIQLKSGSWLRGQFKYLQDRKLEFDNDELDDQTFKLKDVRQLYPAKPAWARFDSRNEPVFGRIVLSNNVVSVSGPEQLLLPRDQLIGLTPSGSRGMRYWSGNLSLGLSLQHGNSQLMTLTTAAELARRTPTTDLVLDYLGNYGEASGTQSANNQRVNLTYDIRLDRHWFIRAGQLGYYYDPLANISLRGTAMVGGGYYIFDRSGLTWNVAAGPAYQYTRFETVETNQSDTVTTPAAVLQTYFKTDITERLTFSERLQTIFTEQQAGQYTHHAVSTLEFKVKRHVDLDVSFVWDYLRDPKAESNGDIPEKSDYYLTVGLGLRF